MNVAEVLSQKPAGVETVGATETLRIASERFDQLKVRGLVVVEGEKPVGVVTLRDVLRALLAPSGSLDASVRQAMSGALFTVTPQTSLSDVQDLIATRQINHVPVVEGDKLVGIVTLADVLRTHLENTEGLHAELHRYICGHYVL